MVNNADRSWSSGNEGEGVSYIWYPTCFGWQGCTCLQLSAERRKSLIKHYGVSVALIRGLLRVSAEVQHAVLTGEHAELMHRYLPLIFSRAITEVGRSWTNAYPQVAASKMVMNA